MSLGRALRTEVESLLRAEERLAAVEEGWKKLVKEFWKLAEQKEVRTQINGGLNTIHQRYGIRISEIEERCEKENIQCTVLYDQPRCPIEGSKMQSVIGLAFSWEHA